MTAPTHPGRRLGEPDELLRRVVPIGKSTSGRPGADAFKPDPTTGAFQPGGRNSRDNGGLSTKREAQHPAVAYWEYLRCSTPPGSRQAIGTWGFKVSEAHSLEGLDCRGDAGIDGNPEHHATVWFPMPEQQSKAKLKLRHEQIAEGLLRFALANDCLYRAADPAADAASLQQAE